MKKHALISSVVGLALLSSTAFAKEKVEPISIESSTCRLWLTVRNSNNAPSDSQALEAIALLRAQGFQVPNSADSVKDPDIYQAGDLVLGLNSASYRSNVFFGLDSGEATFSIQRVLSQKNEWIILPHESYGQIYLPTFEMEDVTMISAKEFGTKAQYFDLLIKALKNTPLNCR